MNNVSEKLAEKITAHCLCSEPSFENCAIFEIMWKNVVERDTPQMTIQYGACALHGIQLRLKTYTHTQYVIFLSFAWQQWLH